MHGWLQKPDNFTPMRDRSPQSARRRGGRQRRLANAVAASKGAPIEAARPGRAGVKFYPEWVNIPTNPRSFLVYQK
jgi:hypothetical protein